MLRHPERRIIPRRFSIGPRASIARHGETQEVSMGYERNDRRWGYSGVRGYGGYGGTDRNRSFGERDRDDDDRARSYGDYGASGGGSAYRDYRGERFNDRPGDREARTYDDDDRGFFDRAGDEVRSWFGDEEAERRRREDQRNDRYAERGYAGQGYGYQGYRSRHEHDPHYRTWRDRQMEALDRDYDEYRHENQNRFETEFGSWRRNRMSQRELLQRVEEHQEVVGSDGQHVGKVDHIRGDRILLAKSDVGSGGHHHSIPCSWIRSVEDKVTIDKTADQARQHWRDEERNQAGQGGLFGRDDDRNVNLNRSFSGTY